MYYNYAGLKPRKQHVKVAPFCTWPKVSFKQMSHMQPVVRVKFQMAWQRKKQEELENKRDSVKDTMFSLSDISHFSTKCARGSKSSCIQLEPLVISSEPNLSFFSSFKHQRTVKNIFTNSNILFRNMGVVTFHSRQFLF